MPSTATSANTAAKVWSENEFLDMAVEYRSTKALLDALVKVEPSERKRAIEKAQTVIGHLEKMSAEASSYTPRSELGFGSENGSAIADAILGRRSTSGKLKTTFAKLGA